MTYQYESTSPERFQQFCQALLLDEYPGLQSFPVGQPDGGRDGLHADSKTVLQVKFKRVDEAESADWMIEALEKELPKIKRLVEAGAKRYVMVTNARGTAHDGVGRIDRVQQWLTDNVQCPAICLWRDDLDRRTDRSPQSLRFKFPELLTGQDGIELALATMLGPQRDRQMRAIRAFVGEQYSIDSKVKFKQVSLSNSLADLFIDIPVRFNEAMVKQIRRKFGKESDRLMNRLMRHMRAVPDEVFHVSGGNAIGEFRYRTNMGAAEFLLSDIAQGEISRIVLEGAPGQGKSTLAQFVCQVHRAAFLGMGEFSSSIPTKYVQSGFRLPFKVDLRDLAAFIGSDTDDSSSLDEFLSDLVHKQSGKQTFSVDDLLDVLGSSPALIFLDGLDEVADLEQRRALVAVVERSILRYEHMGLDVQVVVTSRPSIFGRKANFDESGFVTIDLASIDKSLVLDYSNKWVKARTLDARESAEVLGILKDKMELPHIVELTRNAMQLTILLSLIHQVGYSLPDQRTDLYRRYLELFLIRESEKDVAVKKHQAVLVEFIQHLAWVLQSQAESAGSRGSISKEDLQEMAREYLVEAKQPEELADDLFGGGLERIFVLVQRVSGLYEFEVQPLREFFCARHLYETSPVGTYRYQKPKGDRAQRFEALAANPFWLNVTRFYAGSYEPGEIGSLVLSLRDLIGDSDPARSLHGREVSFALLSDWVFANKKSWQDELIQAACDEAGLHLLVRQVYGESEPLALDEDCGRDTLRDLIFDRLENREIELDSVGYCRLLAANGGNELLDRFLKSLKGTSGRVRTVKFSRMIQSGGAQKLSLSRVLKLVHEDSPSYGNLSERLILVVNHLGHRVAGDEDAAQEVVTHALEGRFIAGLHSFSTLGVFADAMSVFPAGVMTIYLHRDQALMTELSVDLLKFAEPASKVPDFVNLVVSNENPFISQHYTANWDQVAFMGDLVREMFGGECWSAYILALRAAGLRTSISVKDADAMFDDRHSLAQRARYARLKRGSVEWWRSALEDAGEDNRRVLFWSALVLSWTSPSVYEALLSDLEGAVERLDEEAFHRLHAVVQSMRRDAEPRRDRKGYVPPLSSASDRLCWLVVAAFRPPLHEISSEIRKRNFSALTQWKERQEAAAELRKVPPRTASDVIKSNWLKRVRNGQRADYAMPQGVSEHCREIDLSLKLAGRIVSGPGDYPREAVIRAHEIVMGNYDAATLTAVSTSEDWSFQE
ncbi:hypothetical protein [Nocardioides conyzicola]|uniref:NACHT domain-containing protein n=1 Tax=Nocardioides conyzicola TaxID=1651781 RepID=A0ABP8WXW4_9ACTN